MHPAMGGVGQRAHLKHVGIQRLHLLRAREQLPRLVDVAAPSLRQRPRVQQAHGSFRAIVRPVPQSGLSARKKHLLGLENDLLEDRRGALV